MTSSKAIRQLPVVLGTFLLAFYVLLAVVADGSAEPNQRHLQLLHLGGQVSSLTGAVAAIGNNLMVSGAAHSTASATWTNYSYETAHLLRHSRSCSVGVVFVGTDLTGSDANAFADVLIDGAVVKRVIFSDARTGFFPLTSHRLVPGNIVPRLIEIVPLDSEYGFVVPVPQRFCSGEKWTIGIRTRGAAWTIAQVGLQVDYVPALTPFGLSFLLTALMGLLAVALLASGCFGILRAMSTLGVEPLVIATLLLLFAPLTYDQWDFGVWLRFSELLTFGGGDPAYIWSASPLWTFVPSFFSAITGAAYVLTTHGPQAWTALFLKVGTGILYCYNAFRIALRAPQRLRRFYAIMTLLLPLGLYELAAGYREIFAGAFALWALSAAYRGDFTLSTIIFSAAASISETLLPMIFLPAAMASIDEKLPKRRLTKGLMLAMFALGLFVAQWFFLVPHDVAKASLAYRFGPAPLGGASWAAALGALGILPPWLPVYSPLFGIALFAFIAALPIASFIRMFREPERSKQRSYESVLAIFVALGGAFSLAFRGTDPNTWYTLIIMTLWYFARVDATNPFPLLLASMQGLAFYAAVGLGDFVNHSYFWPNDRGLLGILGVSRYVFDLMTDGLIISLVIALSLGKTRLLFSRASPWFLVLFCSAVATTAIRFYALDLIVCAATTTMLVLTFARLIAVQRQYRNPPFSPAMQGVEILTMVGSAVLLGSRSWGAGLCAAATLLTAARNRIGLCDIALGLGAAAVLAVQSGFGWVSIFGWVGLSLASLFAVVATVVARRRKDAFV